MDRFTVYSIALLVLISSAIIVASYIGHKKGALEGTDDIVEDLATSTTHVQAKEIVPAIPEKLEPIGFTLAGVFGGLLVGYFWEDVFGEGGRE